MVGEVIKKYIKEYICEKFPHCALPQAVFAKVTKGGKEKVTLRILDKTKQVDTRYEELPDIETEFPYQTGDEVIISFLHGELENPIILRKYDQLPQIRFAKVLTGGSSMTVQILDKNGGADTHYEPFVIHNDYPLEAGDTAIISFSNYDFKKGVIIRKFGNWKKPWWEEV